MSLSKATRPGSSAWKAGLISKMFSLLNRLFSRLRNQRDQSYTEMLCECGTLNMSRISAK